MEMKHSRKTSNLINHFLKKTGATDPANFQGFCMEYFAALKSVVQVDNFLYDGDIVDGSKIGQQARSVVKYSNTKRLLRYSSHICYVSNKNACFKT